MREQTGTLLSAGLVAEAILIAGTTFILVFGSFAMGTFEGVPFDGSRYARIAFAGAGYAVILLSAASAVWRSRRGEPPSRLHVGVLCAVTIVNAGLAVYALVRLSQAPVDGPVYFASVALLASLLGAGAAYWLVSTRASSHSQSSDADGRA